MRLLHLHRIPILATMALMIENVFFAFAEPIAVLGDRILTGFAFVLDLCLPMAAVAGPPMGHPLSPTREVTYLQTGLHRLAQPRSHRLAGGSGHLDGSASRNQLDNGTAQIAARPGPS